LLLGFHIFTFFYKVTPVALAWELYIFLNAPGTQRFTQRGLMVGDEKFIGLGSNWK